MTTTTTNHDWFQNLFPHGISKRGGMETATIATTTTANWFDFITLNYIYF
jgi:hypothetical protein